MALFRTSAAVTAASLALISVGCGKKKGSSGGGSPKAIETTISASGGTLTISTGELKGSSLVVEAGSLPEGTKLSMAPAAKPAELAALTFSEASIPAEIKAVGKNGEPIYEVEQPITVTLALKINPALHLAPASELCVLGVSQSRKLLWRSDDLSFADGGVTFSTNYMGIYQAVYCGTSEVEGFNTGASRSVISDAQFIAIKTIGDWKKLDATKCAVGKGCNIVPESSATSLTVLNVCEKDLNGKKSYIVDISERSLKSPALDLIYICAKPAETTFNFTVSGGGQDTEVTTLYWPGDSAATAGWMPAHFPTPEGQNTATLFTGKSLKALSFTTYLEGAYKTLFLMSPTGTTLPVDFSQATPLVEKPVTIANPAPEDTQFTVYSRAVFPKLGVLGYKNGAQVADISTVKAFVAQSLPEGAFHETVGNSMGDQGNGTMWRKEHRYRPGEAAPITFTFLPKIENVTVSQPLPRPTIGFVNVSNKKSIARAAIYSGPLAWRLSRDQLAGQSPSVVFEFPDLSGLEGWQSAWDLKAETPSSLWVSTYVRNMESANGLSYLDPAFESWSSSFERPLTTAEGATAQAQ